MRRLIISFPTEWLYARVLIFIIRFESNPKTGRLSLIHLWVFGSAKVDLNKTW